MSDKKKIYHFLHESAAGSTEAEWKDGLLQVELPYTVKDSVDKRLEKEGLKFADLCCELNVDPRDRRTLVVFDGHIPWGGIPKRGDIIYVQDLMESIEAPKNKLRKHRMHEEPPSRIYFYRPIIGGVESDKEFAKIRLHRYFLLLSKGVSCVRKYNDKSLRPIYVFIEVNEKGVTWRTSSY